MDEWVEHVINTAYSLLKKSEMINDKLEIQFKAVSDYCRGLSYNVLGKDRMKTIPEYKFEYDIQRWIDEKNDIDIEKFKIWPKKLSFVLTEEQFEVVQNNIDVYGDSQIGKSKALKMIPIKLLWRVPK